MPLTLKEGHPTGWEVRKIAVVGPGIVGMPMAALLAAAEVRIGTDEPAEVVVLQRRSATSGWKVDAINAGKSPIGGVEPDLDRIVREAVGTRSLRATDDPRELRDADMILVCVQTDRRGLAPDYGPLFEALEAIAGALRNKPPENVPIIVFESTLAPSSMTTLVRDHFARYGLVEGRDVLLANSPNRVMPGRLVERVAASDKIVAGLSPATPALVAEVYRRVVTQGTLYQTNSLTAEIVKTLENAYRDVRIAFASEVVRYCDALDLDFYAVREAINTRLAQSDAATADPNAVPSGALLVPMLGVGGHCLPKDGILLWWRRIEAGGDTSRSLILSARAINDAAPAEAAQLAERAFGGLAGKRVTLLGAAYRFNSEDTRNSPTFVLARRLIDAGAGVTIHDPYVYPTDQNLHRFDLADRFTRDLGVALERAEYAFACTAHRDYAAPATILSAAPTLRGMVDACNLYHREQWADAVRYIGIGRGVGTPPDSLLDDVENAFRAVERGLANEVARLVQFLNERYVHDDFNEVSFDEVRRLAGTCVTGCRIVDAGRVSASQIRSGFRSRLAEISRTM